MGVCILAETSHRRVEARCVASTSLIRRSLIGAKAGSPRRGGVTMLAAAAHVRHDGRCTRHGYPGRVPGDTCPGTRYTSD